MRTPDHQPTCVHTPGGLCPECQADYEEDPQAWWEFGSHPEGIARWEELEREMDSLREIERREAEWVPEPPAGDEIPF